MARQALTLVAALSVALLVYLVLVGMLFRRLDQFVEDHLVVHLSRGSPAPAPFVAPPTPDAADDAFAHLWTILAALIAPLLWCCVELHILLLRRRQGSEQAAPSPSGRAVRRPCSLRG